MTKEEAIAKLILSTKRHKRQFDLITIYELIQFLISSGESIADISSTLKISSGMLSQFLQVKNISPDLRGVFESRELDSVTLVKYLSKFNHHDQMEIVKAIRNQELSQIDVRALYPLRKKHLNEDINGLIDRLVLSKDKKISVIKIPYKRLKKPFIELKKSIVEIVGEKNIVSFEKDSHAYVLKISKQGEKNLRNYAKSLSKSLVELIDFLL